MSRKANCLQRVEASAFTVLFARVIVYSASAFSFAAVLLAPDVTVTLAGPGDPGVALGFSPPGYELFAEADAQGLTVSTVSVSDCKINTPRKTSRATKADRMNKRRLEFTLIFFPAGK